MKGQLFASSSALIRSRCIGSSYKAFVGIIITNSYFTKKIRTHANRYTKYEAEFCANCTWFSNALEIYWKELRAREVPHRTQAPINRNLYASRGLRAE